MATRDEPTRQGRPTEPNPGREHEGPGDTRLGGGDRDRVVEQAGAGPTGRGGDEAWTAQRSAARVKTSAAAAFALALGVAAFVLVITVVLAPIGTVLGLTGLILGIVGIRGAGKPTRTGRGVAISGLVFSVLALLLVAAAAIGITTVLNDPAAVNQLQQQVDQLRGQAPSLPAVPGS